MTQIQQEFNQQKENAKDKLLALQSFLQKGDELGVNVKQSLEKVEIARQKVSQRKLKVAFIGGFSEGKTSIVAAWLEESKDDMKISSAESSDEVVIYNVNGNDEIEIIDTPGLFGFKEKGIGADKEKYKDMTKKFVSEADIVLYVMNPKNPIKESHKEDLEWLFKTLNLLPRTIFVLSKFDEVADMEDREEFNDVFKIKKEQSIIPRLQSLIKLSDDEINNLQIVAVSANPFNKGLETIGINVGKMLNFKPWGAVNFAKGANTALAVAGVVLEVWDTIKRQEMEQKFQEAKRELNNLLENQMKDILETINDDSKFLMLFQGYEELENALNTTQQNLEKIELFNKEFNEWVKQGKVLAIEYKA